MPAGAEHRSIFECVREDGALDGLREVSHLREEPLLSSKETSSQSHGGGVTLCPAQSCVGEGRREGSLVREVSDRMGCSSCQSHFDSREEQTEHYKLDWHRFNLRQRIVGRPPVTSEEFERKSGVGDMSSISGSDSDSEDSDEDSDSEEQDSAWALNHALDHALPPAERDSGLEAQSSSARQSSRVVFQNALGQRLSVFRCVLQSKSEVGGDLVASLLNVSSKALWVVLMTGGGHFAGAVFQGREVLQHKTFHRYTVRAKRGTAQGLRDAKGSHAPKSAGAALRRHNEAALVKEIQDLLESWAEHLREASVIFLRAPSYNRSVFFGGRAAAVDRRDPRVRTLPFPTRRATFTEVRRVHELLSSLHVYGKDTDVSDILSPAKKGWRKKAPKHTAQAHPNPDGTAPPAGAEEEEEEEEEEGSSGEQQEVVLETEEVTISTLDLREYEVHPCRPRRRRRRERRKEGRRDENGASDVEEDDGEEEAAEAAPAEHGQEKPDKSRTRRRRHQNTRPEDEEEEAGEPEPGASWEYALRDALYTACKVGDAHTLLRLLGSPGETGRQGEDQGPRGLPNTGPLNPNPNQGPSALLHTPIDTPLALLNTPVDSSGFTLLHVASAAGQKGVVRLLMDAGADPACRDQRGQTPYAVAPQKDTRNAFRKYMAEKPDKYDYAKAQIPGPLTAEIESKKSEKKKAQKAAKKQREKEQKEERRKREMEEEEKRRFVALSDREKRALAAERRLAQQNAAAGSSVSNSRRCWQCGESLLAKVPFQYLDFSFCSPRCVQTHRKANS